MPKELTGRDIMSELAGTDIHQPRAADGLSRSGPWDRGMIGIGGIVDRHVGRHLHLAVRPRIGLGRGKWVCDCGRHGGAVRTLERSTYDEESKKKKDDFIKDFRF